MAAVLALSLCACSLTENETSSEAPAQTEAVSAAAPVSDDSTEQTDPMLEPKKVAITYMKAQGKGFDEELTKIMSDYYAARYEYLMSTDPGEQFEYNEDDFKFEFDHDNCGFIAKVNVEESYDKACGLAVTATYGEGVEPVSKYIVLIQDSSDKQWKICYVGTKADAYLSKTIEDEYSQKIMDNAKAVYDALNVCAVIVDSPSCLTKTTLLFLALTALHKEEVYALALLGSLTFLKICCKKSICSSVVVLFVKVEKCHFFVLQKYF